MADPNIITDETIATAVKWVVGTIVSIGGILGGILGVNKLAELRMKRKYATEDKASEIHETNQGKSIDADAAAFLIFSKRLELVEGKLERQEVELRQYMKDNATLTAENVHLKDNDSRLREKITKLEDHIAKQDGVIAALRTELDALKLIVDNYHRDGKIDQPFKVEIVSDEE